MQGRIQEFLIGGGGGVQTLVQKGSLNFFVANSSHRDGHDGQSVNGSRYWRGKYSFACRGEHMVRGYPKTMTFFNIPGI